MAAASERKKFRFACMNWDASDGVVVNVNTLKVPLIPRCRCDGGEEKKSESDLKSCYEDKKLFCNIFSTPPPAAFVPMTHFLSDILSANIMKKRKSRRKVLCAAGRHFLCSKWSRMSDAVRRRITRCASCYAFLPSTRHHCQKHRATSLVSSSAVKCLFNFSLSHDLPKKWTQTEHEYELLSTR